MLFDLLGLRGRVSVAPSPLVSAAGRRSECLNEGRIEGQAGCKYSAGTADADTAIDRRRAVEMALQGSLADENFLSYVRAADAYRDDRRWSEGEHSYWRALGHYPLHRSYRVQYGHCLKEQGKYIEAEAEYRNAMSLGELESDVIRHLRFVTEKSGRSVSGQWLQAVENFWSTSVSTVIPLTAPATSQDVRNLSEILLGHTELSIPEIMRLLDRAPRQSDVVRTLMTLPTFVDANRDLLRVIAGNKDVL